MGQLPGGRRAAAGRRLVHPRLVFLFVSIRGSPLRLCARFLIRVHSWSPFAVRFTYLGIQAKD
jgi:hypothetical protein